MKKKKFKIFSFLLKKNYSFRAATSSLDWNMKFRFFFIANDFTLYKPNKKSFCQKINEERFHNECVVNVMAYNIQLSSVSGQMSVLRESEHEIIRYDNYKTYVIVECDKYCRLKIQLNEDKTWSVQLKNPKDPQKGSICSYFKTAPALI